MKQLLATIIALQPPTSHFRLLTLASPDLPHLRAGQLVLARVNDSFDPYLRRAYFALPHAHTPTLDLLVSTDDPLARKAVADALDLIAPVGNGFALDASTRRLLLLGNDAQLAPLIALAHEATAKQVAVTMAVSSQSSVASSQTSARSRPPSADLLSSLLPLDVEFQFVNDIPDDLLRWPDQICAAGTMGLYAQLKERLARVMPVAPQGFAQAVVAPPMACGFGTCLACAVETLRGVRLACVEGAVFDLMELVG